jgi:hypothetical protein
MTKTQELSGANTELATQPFLYEIRVKGRLSQEQWTSWFDNLTVTTKKGETLLRGTLPDRTALYGLLARFRDLAVPLVAVNVLDAEAQLKLHAQSRRYKLLTNLLLIFIYLLMLGGLSAMTVFITKVINTALALAILFAVLGGLAYALSLWSDQKAWQYITYLMWPSSMLTFFIYLAVARLMNTAVVIAVLLFLGAGGLIYLVYFLQGRSDEVNHAIIEWEALGDRSASPTESDNMTDAAKRDKPPIDAAGR